MKKKDSTLLILIISICSILCLNLVYAATAMERLSDCAKQEGLNSISAKSKFGAGEDPVEYYTKFFKALECAKANNPDVNNPSSRVTWLSYEIADDAGDAAGIPWEKKYGYVFQLEADNDKVCHDAHANCIVPCNKLSWDEMNKCANECHDKTNNCLMQASAKSENEVKALVMAWAKTLGVANEETKEETPPKKVYDKTKTREERLRHSNDWLECNQAATLIKSGLTTPSATKVDMNRELVGQATNECPVDREDVQDVHDGYYLLNIQKKWIHHSGCPKPSFDCGTCVSEYCISVIQRQMNDAGGFYQAADGGDAYFAYLTGSVVSEIGRGIVNLVKGSVYVKTNGYPVLITTVKGNYHYYSEGVVTINEDGTEEAILISGDAEFLAKGNNQVVEIKSQQKINVDEKGKAGPPELLKLDESNQWWKKKGFFARLLDWLKSFFSNQKDSSIDAPAIGNTQEYQAETDSVPVTSSQATAAYQEYILSYNKLTDLMSRGLGDTPEGQQAYKEYQEAKIKYESLALKVK